MILESQTEQFFAFSPEDKPALEGFSYEEYSSHSKQCRFLQQTLQWIKQSPTAWNDYLNSLTPLREKDNRSVCFLGKSSIGKQLLLYHSCSLFDVAFLELHCLSYFFAKYTFGEMTSCVKLAPNPFSAFVNLASNPCRWDKGRQFN